MVKEKEKFDNPKCGWCGDMGCKKCGKKPQLKRGGENGKIKL